MRLVVQEHVDDEQHSLDCFFCDEKDQDHLTVLTFYDETTSNALVVCPEHLDLMVRSAIDRHKEGIERGDQLWYLDADDDPWEDFE